MSDDSDNFLSRWSRRKRRDEPDSREPEAPADSGSAGAASEAAEIDEAEQQRIVDSLPDVDSLTEESDFTAFMQAGVPEHLKRKALRRLWRLNPVFANLDGLNDYDLNYTDAATVVENLKSAYQAGRGYLTGEDEAPAAADKPAPAQPQAEAPGTDEPEQPDEPAQATAEAAPETAPAGEADEAAEPSTETASREPRAGRPRGGAARRRWGGDLG